MLKAYISSVSDVSEICLQVFQMDVANENRNVVYVAMVVHVCCKGLFSMFHLCFRMNVANMFI
jgi:hypothetical protein